MGEDRQTKKPWLAFYFSYLFFLVVVPLSEERHMSFDLEPRMQNTSFVVKVKLHNILISTLFHISTQAAFSRIIKCTTDLD